MLLTPEEALRLRALCVRYKSLSTEDRFEAVLLLAKRDGTLGTQYHQSTQKNRYTLQCPAGRHCCDGLIWAINAQIDHIDPQGPDAAHNFRAICQPCNASKGDS